MSKKGSGEKKFGTSLFGFNKVDVNLYLESLIKSYNDSLWEKENQISELKREIEELKKRNKQYIDELAAIGETKDKIANVFLDAQKNAEQIVENARKSAIMEKHKLEAESEELRELIVDRRETLRNIREAARSFGNDLELIMNNRIKLFKEEIEKSVQEADAKYFSEYTDDLNSLTEDNSQIDVNIDENDFFDNGEGNT